MGFTNVILLSHKPARFDRKRLDEQGFSDALYAIATWSNAEIVILLNSLTPGCDTPLSCLGVKTLPGS